jgi:hypothetical protein
MDVSGTGGAAQQKDVYWIVRAAVESKRPISAVYHNRHRVFCPHRLGRNKAGQWRVLCYQYGGESENGLMPAGSPDNWRCIALGSGAWNFLTVDGGPHQPLTAGILYYRPARGRGRLPGA